MTLPADSNSSEIGAHLRRFGAHVSFMHVCIVLLSLMLTLGAWHFAKQQVETRTQAQFETSRDNTIGLIRDGMQKYEDALWAGVSAVESHKGSMKLDQWEAFAKTLRVDERYPGISGIGIIHHLKRDDLPAYMSERRAERPDFRIYPDTKKQILMPISFIEPSGANSAAIGLDVAHERNRRRANFASRDSGTAQITGPIVLVQDEGATAGFLFLAPIYSDESIYAQNASATVETRRESFIGVVYAPFVVRKLMAGLLAKERRDVRFSIKDAGQTIYDEHEDADPLNDPDPMFQSQFSLDLYGRKWEIDLRTNLNFHEENTFAQPTLVLAGGLIIEALIISMFVLMSRANVHAINYAEKVTMALRDEKRKLAATNEELEQFAYVASHDLKTPIRGIGGLAEMLKEDLEDYLVSPDADPEVAANLDRIQSRVVRMNDLTNGIMKFSRAGEFEYTDAPLDLQEVIASMVSDFGITTEQVILSSDFVDVQSDTLNLRRVLENLVGNAVKYHDGRTPLRIEINVQKLNDRIRFEVYDNGPGIDPKFHNRIFDVFQTLRLAGEQESTGIGLAIVKKIVERHGGAVVLDSDLGRGAAFRFDWPLNPISEPIPTRERAA